MSHRMRILFLTGLILCMALSGWAEDMRAANRALEREKQALLEKAEAEAARAKAEAAAARKQLAADKTSLEAALAALRKKKAGLEKKAIVLHQDHERLSKERQALQEAVREAESQVRGIGSALRTGVKELRDLSPQVFHPEKDELNAVIENPQPPAMHHIRLLVDRLLQSARISGDVRISNGPIVDRTGREVDAEILMLGGFTAAYRTDKETGYLLFSDTSHRLFALSKLPPAGIRRQLTEYFNGRSEAVPMDISGGAALRELAHRTDILERIQNGGPIVWPILAVAVLALILCTERIIHLLRTHLNGDKLMAQLRQRIESGDWAGCREICATLGRKPLGRVLTAGVGSREMARPDLENILQETILKEIPPLERFLSTLAVLAAVAPLLGLLGTVTGMINTFHAITFFGTGDPRTMSGGISEALTTTMLGLATAIPILLAHTLLNRRVEENISQMEEKAVALVNMIHTRQRCSA